MGLKLMVALALWCPLLVRSEEFVPVGVLDEIKTMLARPKSSKPPALRSFQVADAASLNILTEQARKYGHPEQSAEGLNLFRLYSEHVRSGDPKDTRYGLILMERPLQVLRLNSEKPIDGLVARSTPAGFLAVLDVWGPEDSQGRRVERTAIRVSENGMFMSFTKSLMTTPDGSAKSLVMLKRLAPGPIDERTVAALWEEASKSVLRLGTDL